MTSQLPLTWEPKPSLVERLRRAAGIYQWLTPLLLEAANRIDALEKERAHAA